MRDVLRVPIAFNPGAQLDDVKFTIAPKVRYSVEVPEPCPDPLLDLTTKN
jgi:hypothetical protein